MVIRNDCTKQLIIDRVRHFRRFETPYFLKCIDEITFYNTGKEVSSVKYTLDTFLPSLHIFDSNGELLEFYGCSDAGDNECLDIEINFPNNRPLSCEDYRTIRLEFIQEVDPLELKRTLIRIPVNETASLYIFLELPDNYIFSRLHYGILDKNNDDELENVNLTVKKGEYFLNISSKPIENTANLYIIFEHEIRKTLSGWYNMGVVFGIISAVSIPFLYLSNYSEAIGIAKLASFVISYLFIIKGWLFTKNMDKALIHLDSKYRFLIYLIFLEITLMILHYIIFIQNE